MRISSKGKYGLMIMIDLAHFGADKPVPLTQVAKRQDVSLNYLEQLAVKLKKAGLLKSIKGPGGGYVLGKEAKDITAYEMLQCLESDLSVASADEKQEGIMRMLKSQLWDELDARNQEFLKGVTLADLEKEYPEEFSDEYLMYYI
ncbi:Rrf2 family cysteine metabolism transcriptional repressor [Lachnospiraceae bacterium PM6-15]|uniref:RrF2 family transcriptional regulator n=1 Tax=Ohessyouella blattaphilus TaxID=2949333 RepID=UPI003E25BD2E